MHNYSRLSHRLPRQSGFTIIEAMIAFAIFTLGFLGYIQIMFKALDNANEYANRVIAQQLVKDMIARIQINQDAAKRTVNQNGYITDPDNGNYKINNCQYLFSAAQTLWRRSASCGSGGTSNIPYGGGSAGSYYNAGVVLYQTPGGGSVYRNNSIDCTNATSFVPYPACYGSMNSNGALYSCCPTQMAQHDIQDWGLLVQQSGLPSPGGVVCMDDNNAPTSSGCTYTGGGVYSNVPLSVAVFWTNKAGVQQNVTATIYIP